MDRRNTNINYQKEKDVEVIGLCDKSPTAKINKLKQESEKDLTKENDCEDSSREFTTVGVVEYFVIETARDVDDCGSDNSSTLNIIIDNHDKDMGFPRCHIVNSKRKGRRETGRNAGHDVNGVEGDDVDKEPAVGKVNSEENVCHDKEKRGEETDCVHFLQQRNLSQDTGYVKSERIGLSRQTQRLCTGCESENSVNIHIHPTTNLVLDGCKCVCTGINCQKGQTNTPGNENVHINESRENLHEDNNRDNGSGYTSKKTSRTKPHSSKDKLQNDDEFITNIEGIQIGIKNKSSHHKVNKDNPVRHYPVITSSEKVHIIQSRGNLNPDSHRDHGSGYTTKRIRSRTKSCCSKDQLLKDDESITNIEGIKTGIKKKSSHIINVNKENSINHSPLITSNGNVHINETHENLNPDDHGSGSTTKRIRSRTEPISSKDQLKKDNESMTNINRPSTPNDTGIKDRSSHLNPFQGKGSKGTKIFNAVTAFLLKTTDLNKVNKENPVNHSSLITSNENLHPDNNREHDSGSTTKRIRSRTKPLSSKDQLLNDGESMTNIEGNQTGIKKKSSHIINVNKENPVHHCPSITNSRLCQANINRNTIKDNNSGSQSNFNIDDQIPPKTFPPNTNSKTEIKTSRAGSSKFLPEDQGSFHDIDIHVSLHGIDLKVRSNKTSSEFLDRRYLENHKSISGRDFNDEENDDDDNETSHLKIITGPSSVEIFPNKKSRARHDDSIIKNHSNVWSNESDFINDEDEMLSTPSSSIQAVPYHKPMSTVGGARSVTPVGMRMSRGHFGIHPDKSFKKSSKKSLNIPPLSTISVDKFITRSEEFEEEQKELKLWKNRKTNALLRTPESLASTGRVNNAPSHGFSRDVSKQQRQSDNSKGRQLGTMNRRSTSQTLDSKTSFPRKGVVESLQPLSDIDETDDYSVPRRISKDKQHTKRSSSRVSKTKTHTDSRTGSSVNRDTDRQSYTLQRDDSDDMSASLQNQRPTKEISKGSRNEITYMQRYNNTQTIDTERLPWSENQEVNAENKTSVNVSPIKVSRTLGEDVNRQSYDLNPIDSKENHRTTLRKRSLNQVLRSGTSSSSKGSRISGDIIDVKGYKSQANESMETLSLSPNRQYFNHGMMSRSLSPSKRSSIPGGSIHMQRDTLHEIDTTERHPASTDGLQGASSRKSQFFNKSRPSGIGNQSHELEENHLQERQADMQKKMSDEQGKKPKSLAPSKHFSNPKYLSNSHLKRDTTTDTRNSLGKHYPQRLVPSANETSDLSKQNKSLALQNGKRKPDPLSPPNKTHQRPSVIRSSNTSSISKTGRSSKKRDPPLSSKKRTKRRSLSQDINLFKRLCAPRIKQAATRRDPSLHRISERPESVISDGTVNSKTISTCLFENHPHVPANSVESPASSGNPFMSCEEQHHFRDQLVQRQVEKCQQSTNIDWNQIGKQPKQTQQQCPPYNNGRTCYYRSQNDSPTPFIGETSRRNPQPDAISCDQEDSHQKRMFTNEQSECKSRPRPRVFLCTNSVSEDNALSITCAEGIFSEMLFND